MGRPLQLRAFVACVVQLGELADAFLLFLRQHPDVSRFYSDLSKKEAFQSGIISEDQLGPLLEKLRTDVRCVNLPFLLICSQRIAASIPGIPLCRFSMLLSLFKSSILALISRLHCHLTFSRHSLPGSK